MPVAKVGGIGFNRENPASLFYENAMMGIQLIHEGYARGIENSSPSERFAPIPSSRPSRSARTTSGTAT